MSTAATKARPAITKDRLGTRKTVLLKSPFTGLAQRMAGASYCGTPTAFGPAQSSKLGPNWTELIARSYACRSAPATGSWTSGQTFTVTSKGAGELICRSQASGEATNIWYKTSKGWVWSGGAVNPVWNTTC